MNKAWSTPIVRAAVLGAIAAFVGRAAMAEQPPIPNALRCEFSAYTAGTSEPHQIAFDVAAKDEGGIDPLIYSALDPDKRTAQMVGNAGASDVTFFAMSTTWSFVEVTDFGNVTVTQVFLWDEPEAELGVYRAVHSRQSSIMGAIAASQHYGHCKALN